MKSCKSCGCVNDNINRYCRNCGKSFENTEETYTPPAVKAPIPTEHVEEPPCDPVPPSSEAEPPCDPVSEEPERDFFDFGPVAPTVLDICAGEGVVLFDTVTEEAEAEPDYIEFDSDDEPEPTQNEPTPAERFFAVSRSPLFLVFAIFASLGFILTLVRAVLTFTGDNGLLGMGTPYTDLADMLFIAGFDRVSVYTAVVMGAPLYLMLQGISLIPAVLYGVGVWLLYAGGHRRKGGVGALGVINTANIICLTGFGLCLTLCLAYGIPAALALFGAPAEQAVHLIALLLLYGTIALISLFGVLYCAFATFSVNRMRGVLKYGVADHRLSVFVMVINLLYALSLSSVSGFYMAGGDMISFALTVTNMFTYVFLTMVMVRLRLELK